MVDRHDRLRHERVAQHISVWREKSQRFQILLVPLAIQSHLLLGRVLLLMLLHLLLPVGDRFHLLIHLSLHPHASAKFHLFRRLRYSSHQWYQRHHCHLLLLMLLSQRYLEEALQICHYCLYTRTILIYIYGEERYHQLSLLFLINKFVTLFFIFFMIIIC